MADFWMNLFSNFLANLFADAIIAIAVLIAITRPSEKKQTRARVMQALGMLKAEMKINTMRARNYIQALDGQTTELKALFPLRYTRGAWNALKESGFLPQLNDPKLIYNLLRVNEAIVVADASLQRVQSAIRERKRIRSLALSAKKDSERLITTIDPLLSILSEMRLPEFQASDLFENK
jgi:hypothetical protein